MIPACVFTYAGGAISIMPCVEGIRLAGLIPVICDDAANPLPGWVRGWLESEGVEYRQTHFPRRGNLNGTDCARGIAGTLYDVATAHGAPAAIKMDDDTIIIRASRFLDTLDGGGVGLSWVDSTRGPGANGMAYMLRRDVALAVERRLAVEPLDPRSPEDLTIWSHVKAVCDDWIEHEFTPEGGAFSHFPEWADPAEASRFDVVTVGNPPKGGWTNRPLEVSRAMRRVVSRIRCRRQ